MEPGVMAYIYNHSTWESQEDCQGFERSLGNNIAGQASKQKRKERKRQAKEMAQVVNCLLYKLEDFNSDLDPT